MSDWQADSWWVVGSIGWFVGDHLVVGFKKLQKLSNISKYFCYLSFTQLINTCFKAGSFLQSWNQHQIGKIKTVIDLSKFYTEFFLVRIFLYLDLIQENTDQKKLRIWTLFTLSMWLSIGIQCRTVYFLLSRKIKSYQE